MDKHWLPAIQSAVVATHMRGGIRHLCDVTCEDKITNPSSMQNIICIRNGVDRSQWSSIDLCAQIQSTSSREKRHSL